eukprot:CAMPEP_0201565146 /NCGR_PEP_ID=MMETSP0190_2-20130828/4026_1 /ASSEMBLY_ACC=CAM_ASM_000263 /TAXON_ID=37353 /ORGANISM="Rosalina sp." /LENGTH=1236 /DNA_ID=CAMNT_0047982275 /DNA_START=109 /DNA_END=3822 /DNA_ORIENTATION=-
MAEQLEHNPYVDKELILARKEYNPSNMNEFESRYDPGDKDKQTIVADSNKEIQRLLLAYLKHCGEKRSESDSQNMASAEAFISFIKYTCIDIIRSKCVIRQSLQYMYEIMESKPVDSALDDKGIKLWKSLKTTLETLNNANSKMLEVGHKYFGFLLKFWEALAEFCRQQTKLKPPSMEISINALQKHLHDFLLFKNDYDDAIRTVHEAAESGMSLFDDVIGGQAISDAFETRKKIEKELDDLKAKLKEKELLSIEKLQGLNRNKADNAGRMAMNLEEIKFHEGVYKTMEEWEEKEKEAFAAAQEKVEKANKIKDIFTEYKMDYHKKKKEIDAKATDLRKETASSAKRDKQYLDERRKQIDNDLRADKGQANKLNNQAQDLLNKAKNTRSDAVSTLNSAKHQSNYESRRHYGYGSYRSWWGWRRSYYSYSYTTKHYTGNSDRYKSVAKDLNRMADDIQNSALKLNDKADAMKKTAIERAQLEQEYQQKQYQQSLQNNQKMLDLANKIQEAGKKEIENIDYMEGEEAKQDDVIKKRETERAAKEAELKAYQKLKEQQEKQKVENVGRLNTENEKLTAENKSLDEKIKQAEEEITKFKKEQESKIEAQVNKLEEINETILRITKQIGVNGKQQLIDFANMTMEIFPNLQNVKDGVTGIKAGFEDFALVLSLRINSQITIGWYFSITSIFDQVTQRVIANALGKRAFNKMNDLNYYDEFGSKAQKKFDKKIKPIITKCLRVKDSSNGDDQREGIDDNDHDNDDDEKSSTTKTADMTFNPTPNFVQVEDEDVIDNYVDKLRKLFIKKKQIYGNKKSNIKGWIELSKEQTIVNREWIISISPSLCYFFNNMSAALKFAMNSIVIESYKRNESRIKSISDEIQSLLKKEAGIKLPIFVFEQKKEVPIDPDLWIKYLTQWKLSKYKDKFEELGYDDPSIWMSITEDEMVNDFGFKKGDILKFNARRKELNKKKNEDKKDYESEDDSDSESSSSSDSDDDSSYDRRKTKKKKSKRKKHKKAKKGKKKKKKKKSKRYESSDSEDDSSDDDSSSDDDHRRPSKKSKKGRKKKKKNSKNDTDTDDEQDEDSSDSDSDNDDGGKQRKKKQNKKDKVKKKKKDKKGKKKKKKDKKGKTESSSENESDEDSEDELSSNSGSSSSSDESMKKKRKKKDKGKVKKKKQNKKKSKKKRKTKTKKESSSDESLSEDSSSGKKTKGKRQKGKKDKKSKKKKVSDDDDSSQSESSSE